MNFFIIQRLRHAPGRCRRYLSGIYEFHHPYDSNGPSTSYFQTRSCMSKSDLTLETCLANVQDTNLTSDSKDGNEKLADDNSRPTRQEVTDKYRHLYDNIGGVQLKPVLPTKSFSLAPFVNDSKTLCELVALGVDLSIVELKYKAANHLLKMDFENDVKPYLLFLHHSGVSADDFGSILTKNPGLFLEDLDDLQVRINYFKSKLFPVESIGRIITIAPAVLSLSTRQIDISLGCLQNEFKLTGAEIRNAVIRYPKLVIHDREKMKDMLLQLKDFMGFTGNDTKRILLNCPKIYFKEADMLPERFDYIHHDMGISHEEILQWPNILETRLKLIKKRHKFLKYLKRDQFDPKIPNYVSLKMLVSGNDDVFCETVAKVPVDTYDTFLKTI